MIKNNKKVISFLLVLIMIFTGLSACSNKGKSIGNNESANEKKPYGIPEFTFGESEVFKQDDRYIIVAKDTTAENYKAYLKKLSGQGFKKYASNNIEDNIYVTCFNDETYVTTYYMAKTGITRVIAEPKGDFYPREQDNVYTSKGLCPLFTGIKGDTSIVEYGMGMLIRLVDGSFIIIDGGFGGKNHLDSVNLLKMIYEQTPEDVEKPVIAAWIFTHPHGDHIGTFSSFVTDFRDKVKIERFYYNFPTELARTIEFDIAMDKYCADVPTIRVHTGDKYYIRNAVIDVLFTYEDHFPNRIGRGEGVVGDLNDSSLIFKIEMQAQTILITGDAMDASLKNLLSSYDSFLKCDIIQLPHHGLTDGYDLFVKANPSYAFLSINHQRYEDFFSTGGGGHKGNLWLINNPKVRQIIPCGNGSVTIPIPYWPDDSEIMDKVPTPETVYMDASNYIKKN